MISLLMMALLMTPILAEARCIDYRRLFGMADLQKKTWSTTHVSKESTRICNELPEPQRPNLKVLVVKDKRQFNTNIFHSLDGFYEYLDKENKMAGGTYKETKLSMDIFIPHWYKNSKLTITEISSGKIIVETKL